MCVPKSGGLRKEIMSEAHRSLYTVHLGGTKMYQDRKGSYWWNNMKRDIAKFVEQYPTCQQVKAEHQRPARTFKPLLILDECCLVLNRTPLFMFVNPLAVLLSNMLVCFSVFWCCRSLR